MEGSFLWRRVDPSGNHGSINTPVIFIAYIALCIIPARRGILNDFIRETFIWVAIWLKSSAKYFVFYLDISGYISPGVFDLICELQIK